MLEVFAFRLGKMTNLIIANLIGVILVSLLAYFMTRKFDFKDSKIKFYGLFLNLRRVDVIILAISFIRMITIIYSAALGYQDVLTSAVILSLLTAIMLFYNFHKFIIEIANGAATIVIIYFINILNNYTVEVEQQATVIIIQVALMLFACIYAVYMFLVNIEDIARKNKKIRERKDEKER